MLILCSVAAQPCVGIVAGVRSEVGAGRAVRITRREASSGLRGEWALQTQEPRSPSPSGAGGSPGGWAVADTHFRAAPRMVTRAEQDRLPGSVLCGPREGRQSCRHQVECVSRDNVDTGLGGSGLRPLWGPEKPGKRVEAAGSGDLRVIRPMLRLQTGLDVLFTSITPAVEFQLWGGLWGKQFGAEGSD